MNLGAKPGSKSVVGVLDAGVVIAWLGQERPSGKDIIELLESCKSGRKRLCLTTVNLAEVLEHSRTYTRQSGRDIVASLKFFGVEFESPGIEVARLAADLKSFPRASLADRFAAATAELIGGRLYTTDRALAEAVRHGEIPVTLFS